MPPDRPFIVTRPAAAGKSLTEEFAARGIDAHWLPAFEIGPAPDPARAEATLARLADFDLALFVSPAAVRATAQLLAGHSWPAATAIGVVGQGTRDAVHEELRFGEAAQPALIAPAALPQNDGVDGDTATGSEAFWQALLARRRASGWSPRRVLILRAEQGRDWLQSNFEQAGAEVALLPVYSRRARAWSADDAAWIAARVAGPPPVLVVTSSEAVDSLCAAAGAVDASGATLRWLQRGRALALHPRIVARLQAAGFADAACVTCDADALLAAA
jgi:uroporphyrinogen-III synthase